MPAEHYQEEPAERAVVTPENPIELAQDLMLTAVLPNHIRVLEKISECLDRDNWQQAVEIGLFSTLASMGGHIDASSPDHPAVQSVKGLHREAVEASNLAARLMEHHHEYVPDREASRSKDAWSFVLPASYTDDERQRAIRILKATVEGLIHGLHELHDGNDGVRRTNS